MPDKFFSIAPFVLAVVIVIIWLAYVSERRRRNSFRTVARQRGLAFSNFGDIDVVKTSKDLPLFSQRGEKTIKNFVHGEVDNVHVKLFDYGYKTDSERSSHRCRQTVLILQSKHLNLPTFALSPENVFHKIASSFGYQDIDFDFHRGFSKAYVLRGKDKHAIREVFTDQIKYYFEKHEGLNLEASRDTLLYYRSGRLIKRDGIQTFLMNGLNVFKLFESKSS